MTSKLKARLRETLEQRTGVKIPTSSTGRIGRMAFTALKGGVMMATAKKGEEAELDPEQLVKLITSIGKLKGIAMKMGQIMSYIDVAMPKEFQEALSVLQTHAQPMAFPTVEAIIREELGDCADALLKDIAPEPISAASIGQVHRSTLEDGSQVAIKIQYPEIAKAIASDFGPAAIGSTMASVFYPNARIDGFIKEAKDRFLEECDYQHEAHCQNEFQKIYAHHPTLFVPKVHSEYCSRRVLTTEFVNGLGFDAFLESNPSSETRDAIGVALFEFYIGSLFSHCIYNCDPHPGNYLFCEGGAIAMLDHGCTRQFEPRFVARLANLTRAVHRDKRDELHKALVQLKIVRDGKKYNYQMIRSFLRSFYGPMLVDEACEVDLKNALEMRDAMKKKHQLMQFTLPGEFTFLFRIRFGLMSVLSRLGAKANWYRLEKQFVDEFARTHPMLSD